MAYDPRDPRFQSAGGRNPLERTVINPADLAAEFLPRASGGASVPPGMMADPDLQERLQRNVPRRTGRFMPLPFTVGVAPVLIVPEQLGRFYLFILNNSGANRIFVGFDYEPNAINGVILEVNLGFYEPWIVPSNSIYVAAAGAGTSGLILLAIEN